MRLRVLVVVAEDNIPKAPALVDLNIAGRDLQEPVNFLKDRILFQLQQAAVGSNHSNLDSVSLHKVMEAEPLMQYDQRFQQYAGMSVMSSLVTYKVPDTSKESINALFADLISSEGNRAYGAHMVAVCLCLKRRPSVSSISLSPPISPPPLPPTTPTRIVTPSPISHPPPAFRGYNNNLMSVTSQAPSTASTISTMQDSLQEQPQTMDFSWSRNQSNQSMIQLHQAPTLKPKYSSLEMKAMMHDSMCEYPFTEKATADIQIKQTRRWLLCVLIGVCIFAVISSICAAVVAVVTKNRQTVGSANVDIATLGGNITSALSTMTLLSSSLPLSSTTTTFMTGNPSSTQNQGPAATNAIILTVAAKTEHEGNGLNVIECNNGVLTTTVNLQISFTINGVYMDQPRTETGLPVMTMYFFVGGHAVPIKIVETFNVGSSKTKGNQWIFGLTDHGPNPGANVRLSACTLGASLPQIQARFSSIPITDAKGLPGLFPPVPLVNGNVTVVNALPPQFRIN